jgi:2-hydroxy-3-keto-5-methylthiopentenyl-1-phosphate phosphatase
VYPFEVPLARAHVFFDFDGTLTPVDVGTHLLDRFAPTTWRASEVRYDRGEIGSRECLVDQWSLLPLDRDRLREAAAEVPLDPAFSPLLEALRASGARVTVVSDGFGFHVEDRLGPLGVEVLTNAVDWATGELTFPHTDRCCPCSTCGTCKQAPLKDARSDGRVTVFVGDGTSDRKAALLADVLFAKGALAAWCDERDVEFTSFRTIADVHAELFDGR